MAYADLLSNFCSNLLGESSKHQNTKAISTNVSKKPHLKAKSDNIKSFDQNTNNQLNCSINKAKKSEPLVTDDGFKIINEIPPDDSDLSDAFDSEIEDFEAYAEGSENGITELKQTEDGFKIINEIPPDDSDVEDAFESENNFTEGKETEDGFKIVNEIPFDDSDVEDAFDSDFDEEKWIEEASSRFKKKSNDSNNNGKNSLKPGLEKLKKPLLNLIQDFGMEDKIYLNENSKLSLKKSESKVQNKKNGRKNKPKNSLSDKELQILDYSIKRGKRKKENLHEVLSENKKTSKEEAEVALKKARYEVFKLGISSGTKVEKKEAKIDLVVKLGARPRKKEAMNYKNLIKLRKSEKEEEKLKLEETREMGLPVKKKPVIREKKNEIDINPRFGKFSNGVLKLTEQDREKILAS